MAYKLDRSLKPVKTKSTPKKGNKMPLAAGLAVGGIGVMLLSLVYVGRVSPKRGDVNSIAAQLRKDNPAGAHSLPSGVQPSRGAKLWAKKAASH